MVNYGTNPFVGRNEAILSLRDFELVQTSDGEELLFVSNIEATFNNCVIHGSKEEEVEVGRNQQQPINSTINFNHCFMKLDTFSQGLNNCIINENPYFEDIDNYVYRPDSSRSQLINNAVPLSPAITVDAEGIMRDADPDIGALEYIP